MSHYDQNQIPVAYPPPPAANPPPLMEGYPEGPYCMPPPMGYPTKGGEEYAHPHPPVDTTTRGEGFWKGCVAALCCCWVFEFCCC